MGVMTTVPCTTERENRDAALLEVRRLRGVYVRAGQRVNEIARAALAHHPPPAEAAWIRRTARSRSTAAINADPPAPDCRCRRCVEVFEMANKRAMAWEALPRFEDALRATTAALRQCLAAHQTAPPDVLPSPEPVPATDQDMDEWWHSLPAVPRERCLRPRSGHGHVGQPCYVRLGQDAACQYHGVLG
jgi:hypothetical protein